MNRLEFLSNIHIAKLRFKYAKRSLREKLNHCKCEPLTNEEKQKIHEFWKGIHVDEKWFQMYRTYSKALDCRYFPDDLYYAFCDVLCYNRAQMARHLDDKNLYSLLFADIRQPKTIARKMRGIFLNEQYESTDIATIVRESLNKSIVIKQSIDSCGGSGVKVFTGQQTEEEIYAELLKYDDIIIQERVIQHPVLASIHSNSLNTIRILTFYDKNEVKILSSILRIGVGTSMVDNASSGGVFCGIRSNGQLKEIGYNAKGIKFDVHPQGMRFDEIHIPNFDKCYAVVKKCALRLINVGRLMSWDIAIGVDGDPILIEVNMSFGEIDFHQMTNGPLFGDETKRIIQEVFSSKKSKLINKYLIR